MFDLEPIKARARAPQTADFMVNAVDDVDALVAEVERLRDGIQKHKGGAMAAMFEGYYQPEQADWDLWGLLDAES